MHSNIIIPFFIETVNNGNQYLFTLESLMAYLGKREIRYCHRVYSLLPVASVTWIIIYNSWVFGLQWFSSIFNLVIYQQKKNHVLKR